MIEMLCDNCGRDIFNDEYFVMFNTIIQTAKNMGESNLTYACVIQQTAYKAGDNCVRTCSKDCLLAWLNKEIDKKLNHRHPWEKQSNGNSGRDGNASVRKNPDRAREEDIKPI